VRPLNKNARASIRDSFEFDSKEIDSSDLHCEKHNSQITSTDRSTQIVVPPPKKRINRRPEISRTKAPSARNIGDNGQNVRKVSSRPSNAEPERKMIPPGIVISATAVKANAYSSIRCSLEPRSNVTDASDLHVEKHFSEITSTDAGI
jgi:hypothetical protein